MHVATYAQMRAIERRAISGGLSASRLMENAGAAAAHWLQQMMQPTQTVVVLCGTGNNGGDGFVIARKLMEHGHAVTVVLVHGVPTAATAQTAFATCGDVSVISADEEPYRAAAAVREAVVVVDAVYGIGFHGTMPEAVTRLFSLVRLTQLRIAVDMPSGLSCDGEMADPHAFSATHTLTFTALKPALASSTYAALYGEVHVLPIGIAEEDIAAVLEEEYISETEVAACFSPRLPDTHKGNYGHLLAVCGSYGMAGAAVLSAKAALRCGVGLLTVALPRSIYPIVAAAVPEAVFLPLPETETGTLSSAALAPLLASLKNKSALLIGCGLGRGESIELLVQELLFAASCPIVFDADGLNALAAHIDSLETEHAPCILTPHPGEMARLTGTTIETIQADRAGCAAAFAARYDVTLVLKGHHTQIASPTARYVNPTGNPGMATGGSGDMLAGMIAAFAAAGFSPEDAAKCGVYLHGKAGDRAAQRLSQHAMLPTDMLDELGTLFLKLEE